MDPFQNSFPMLANRALAAITPPFRRVFARHGVTEQQWRILRILWHKGPTSQNEIAKQALLPKQSLVGILDRMERLTLVERKQSLKDRRKSEIHLTPKAKRMEKKINDEVEQIYRDLEGLLSTSEWTKLRRMLERIADQGLK